MWYHALTPETPANDAPAQLLEQTFRDEKYLSNLPTVKLRKELGLEPMIPAAELVDLVNYDVSYVDSILSPVAMEATDVPLNPNAKSNLVLPYGWIGASQSIPEMQKPIQDFVTRNPSKEQNINGMGEYFNLNGYPSYYIPKEFIASTGIKLPSGQNLIADSPYNDVRSSYDNDQFTLTSGGGVNELHIGGQDGKNFADQDFVIVSNIGANETALKQLKDGFDAGNVYDVSGGGDYIQPKTTVAGVDVAAGKVTLSQKTKPGVTPPKSSVFNFIKPVKDYAADRLLNLWYSWAQYYVTNFPKDVKATDIVGGSIPIDSRVLTFNENVTMPPLAAGMVVNGPGTTLPVNTTVMRVEGRKVFLSQDATVAATNAGFHFEPPKYESLAGTTDPHIGTLLNLKPSDFAGEKVDPLVFSQHVYQVMSAMSTIPGEQTALKVLLNVIGCNVGKIPHIGNKGTDNKDSKSDISNEIRDLTKSLLRGVADFTAVSESEWYPDPSRHIGPHAYNVYNLDPFVWFVHRKLGLSGYGFSVDDDVADVGAFKATKLHVGIGGLGAHGDPNVLPQKAEWTWGAPYGPFAVTGQVSHTDPLPDWGKVAPDLNTISLPDADLELYWKLYPTDKGAGFVGAIVNGPGVTRGTRFAFRVPGQPGIVKNKIIVDENLNPDILKPGQDYTFSFYGPVTDPGYVEAATPRVIRGMDVDAIAQLKIMFVQGADIRVDGSAVLKKGPEVFTRIVKVTDTTVEVDNDLMAVSALQPVRFTFS